MSAAEDLVRALSPSDIIDYIADRGDEGGDPERDQIADRFVIDNLDKAAWAIERIGLRRRNFAQVEAAAKARHDRIDAWVADERQRLTRATEYLEGLLERYHQQRITADNPGAATWADVKHSKTIRTPAGDLVARKAPDRVEVDEAVFVPWAIGSAIDLLNPPKPRTPDKAAIKRLVGDVMENGDVVDSVTGQFLPGVKWVDGDVTYTVKTPEAGQ